MVTMRQDILEENSTETEVPEKYRGTVAEEFLDIEAEEFEVSDESYEMLYDILEDADRRIDDSDEPREILEDVETLIKEEYGFRPEKGVSMGEGLDYDDPTANCSVYTVLFHAIGEAKDLPISAVHVPEHSFIRYGDEDEGVDWDPTNRFMSSEVSSEEYIEAYDVPEETLSETDYMQNLTREEIKARAYNQRGFFRRREGDEEGALRDYNKAISMNPGAPEFYVNRAVAEDKLEMQEKALEDYRRGTSLNPLNACWWWNRSILADEEGNPEEALGALDRIVELDPNTIVPKMEEEYGDRSDLHYFRIRLMEEIGADPAELEEEYSEFLKCADEAWAYFERGVIRESQDSIVLALADYMSAADEAEDEEIRAKAHSKVGVSGVELRDTYESLEYHNKAVEAEFEDSDIYANRAEARKEIGDWTGAIEDYQRALEMDPEDEDIRNDFEAAVEAYSQTSGSTKLQNSAIPDQGL